MRKLGKVQQEVLASLKRHGSWHHHCGWLWDTPSNTQRLMDSLVRAGYATSNEGQGGGWIVYRPIDPATDKPAKRLVVLSGGDRVDGDDALGMLRLQNRILLKLSRALALSGVGEGSPTQKAIADANMLGLEVADRLKEVESKES